MSWRLRLIRSESAADAAVGRERAEYVTWRDTEGRVAALGTTCGAWHFMEMPGVGHFAWSDADDEVRVQATGDDAIVEDAFRRAVLPMALSTRGFAVLHASAVAGREGVVGFCAASGTGKSTLARALASRPGRAIWADDALAVGWGPQGARALPLPFRLSLRRPSAAHFAGAAAPSTALTTDVRRLSALFLVRRDDGAPRSATVESLTPGDAFPAVLEQAYAFDLREVARRRSMLDGYLALVADVPVFVLYVRSGFDRLPAVLDAVEERLATGAARP